MSPWEMRNHFDYLLSQAEGLAELDLVRKRLDRLVVGWSAAWAEFADMPAGLPHYRSMILAVQQDLDRIGGHAIMLRNKRSLYRVLQGFIFENAVESERVRASKAAANSDLQPSAS
jgi:hypothetical protein